MEQTSQLLQNLTFIKPSIVYFAWANVLHRPSKNYKCQLPARNVHLICRTAWLAPLQLSVHCVLPHTTSLAIVQLAFFVVSPCNTVVNALMAQYASLAWVLLELSGAALDKSVVLKPGKSWQHEELKPDASTVMKNNSSWYLHNFHVIVKTTKHSWVSTVQVWLAAPEP